MRKLVRRVVFCLVFAAAVGGIGLIRDRNLLDSRLIRLHVVANSDSPEDQQIKLQVRDAILESIGSAMEDITDPELARAYLAEKLPRLEQIANDTLTVLGCEDRAVVSLCREVFDIRHYDTFSLPSGVYEALRIVIGEGEGHNWWCVAFPSLCLPATREEFEDTAAAAGFPEPLRESLTGDSEIRFYLLDFLGKLQTRFFDSP